MAKDKSTISGGLGLSDSFFEKAQELVLEKLKAFDTISDALESAAEGIRDEELGESNLKVSDYEKKLILSGFIMGTIRASAEAKHKLDELKLLALLMEKSKKVGEDEKGGAIFGGAISPGDIPEELRGILGKIIGRQKDEDDDEDDD
jgi:hypothetical protein